jgi:hypothetical protein
VANLNWYRCGEPGRWCSLLQVDLDCVEGDEGIYVIWHKGRPARVVSVGQGVIAKRVGLERRDPGVLFYERFGTLHVSWAVVPPRYRDGIERFLIEEWKPLVGGRQLKAKPIPVNPPWE